MPQGSNQRNLAIVKTVRHRGAVPASPPNPVPYHHGSLPTALLDAAGAILERDGFQALTLRAVARAAGVSHAAPAHLDVSAFVIVEDQNA